MLVCCSLSWVSCMTSFASSQALPNHPVWTKIVPRCRPACAHQSAWHSVQTYIYSLLFCTHRSAQTHLLWKWSSAFQGDVETWPAYIETLVWEWSIFNLAVCCALCACKQAVWPLIKATVLLPLVSFVFASFTFSVLSLEHLWDF